MPAQAIQLFKNLNRRLKMAIAMCVDSGVAALALWLTYAASSFALWPPSISRLWWLLPLSSVITVTVFYAFGLYHTVIRFAGSRFFLNAMVASVLVSWIVGLAGLMQIYSSGAVPTAIFVIYPFYLMVGAAGIRLVARQVLEIQLHPDGAHNNSIIYGAGSGGTQLYSAIRYVGEYRPIAFVDDDVATHGHRVHGLRVYSPQKLATLIKRKKVKTVLLAIPSLSPFERAKIIKHLQSLNVLVQTTPSFSELITQRATFGDLRTPNLEDILTRTEVKADEKLAEGSVAGKSVLVTGAGGSIGSELCRQILTRNPSKIVLFDIAESALFFIEQELLKRKDQKQVAVEIVPVLGSVVDQPRLQETLLAHDVKVVFHAAAYKHVSMLELNPLEGARNNIIGTRCVFDASAWANCELLVLVSTDKAVRPSSFMGATKRIAELAVQASTTPQCEMKTCIVRFGNVLGSSGSVVPIFHEQIISGGPVTVTNPNATRYFMTIPEAAQLILQSGALAQLGEIFVLEMGEPIRIVDLATRMIELQGKTVKDSDNPKGDIAIEFTTLRPGEKLHEELAINDNLTETKHAMIKQSVEDELSIDQIGESIIKIEEAICNGDISEIVRQMQGLIEGFEPSWDKCSSKPLIEQNLTPAKVEHKIDQDTGL